MSHSSLKRSTIFAAALLSVFAMSAPYAHEGHDHHAMDMATKQPIKFSTASYTIPSVQLVREDGKAVDLASEIDDGRAVVLNFVFTSCTDICPLTTDMLSKFQTKLGKSLDKVHIITISIDPEQDTPATLKKYAQKYKAKSQWNFYTGTVEASIEAQKAFQAYNGDKMNHVPATYLRAAPGKPWQRIDGFVSPDELLSSYRELIAAK
jgi:protein SCO1